MPSSSRHPRRSQSAATAPAAEMRWVTSLRASTLRPSSANEAAANSPLKNDPLSYSFGA